MQKSSISPNQLTESVGISNALCIDKLLAFYHFVKSPYTVADLFQTNRTHCIETIKENTPLFIRVKYQDDPDLSEIERGEIREGLQA